MITLLVMTDGRRSCVSRTIPSAIRNLRGPITTRVIYDDSADPTYTSWLHSVFGPEGFTVISSPTRLGFGGAIDAAWHFIRENCRESYVFHLEDDFTFNRDVDLYSMIDVLKHHSYLVQLALRRQPWNDDEKKAGGIVEQHPEDYEEVDYYRHRWLEHRRFFTTNPSLYRSSLCEKGWVYPDQSEGRFTLDLLEHGLPGIPPAFIRFGFWGPRDSGEWVTHIGAQRIGTGY